MSESMLTAPPIRSDNKRKSTADAAPASTETAPRPHEMLSLGDRVLWFFPGDRKYVALVRQINPSGSLRLTVFGDNPTPDVSRLAVNHVSEAESTDPNVSRNHYGLWDFYKGHY